MKAYNVFSVFLFAIFVVVSLNAQIVERSAAALWTELDRFENEQRKAITAKGERYSVNDRDRILDDKRSLAKKYAAEIEARTGLGIGDVYYLARIYLIAENNKKALETMQRYVSLVSADASGEVVKSALGHIVVLSSGSRQMDIAEAAFERYKKTEPVTVSQQAALRDHLASGYYKSGDYEHAVEHAQTAFDLLKTLNPRNAAEKRSHETIYMNLVEILALGYRKNKNSDQALSVLAEARAKSFTIPSANLYRKVMDFVEGSGFSEKKMMQKIDSYASADPAPDISITDWIGEHSGSLQEHRGKVVLLDFWATWCGPCIATFPRLRAWHKKFAGNDFVIIGITQFYGEQDGKKMTKLLELDYLRAFREKYKLPYTFAVSQTGEAASKYGIAAYPTTVLLDRNGVVRYIGIGAGTEESENLESSIKKVLAEGQPFIAQADR
jgi:thiol-disulfide isomerase/thioredoxin